MARGRFISKTLSDSKRFSSLESERAALIYTLILPHANVDGRFDSDSTSLLAMCGRFALTHGWDLSTMAEARKDLGDAGLWDLWEIDVDEYAEVVDFHEHNKVRRDREPSGTIPRAGAGPGPGPRPEPAATSISSSLSISEVEEQGRGSAPDTPPSTFEDRSKRTPDHAQRLLRAHRWSYRLQNEAAAANGGQVRYCPGFPVIDAERAIRDGCPVDAFDDTTLATEMLRVASALYQLELTPSPKAVCKHLGQEFDRPEVEKRHRWPVTWEQWREAQGSPESDAKPGGGTNGPPEGVAGDTGREAAEEEASSG